MLYALINTIGVALVGYIIGSVLSFFLAYITFHYRFLDNMLGGIIFFLFSSPLIVLVWIVHGSIPVSIFASYLFVSLVVIFPIYSHVRNEEWMKLLHYIQIPFLFMVEAKWMNPPT